MKNKMIINSLYSFEYVLNILVLIMISKKNTQDLIYLFCILFCVSNLFVWFISKYFEFNRFVEIKIQFIFVYFLSFIYYLLFYNLIKLELIVLFLFCFIDYFIFKVEFC